MLTLFIGKAQMELEVVWHFSSSYIFDSCVPEGSKSGLVENCCFDAVALKIELVTFFEWFLFFFISFNSHF
jgi:hypothetical protein